MLHTRELIADVLIDRNLEVVEVFEYGSKKIEFMVKFDKKIISISVTDDLSYDYMVFDGSGEKMLYSNTEKMASVSRLSELLENDLSATDIMRVDNYE